MKLKPLRDKIVVKVDEREKSKVLAVVMEEKPNTGEIVAVGPGQYDHKGRFISMPLRVGQRVRFGTMGKDEYLSYLEYEEDGITYNVMSWKDVCFVEEPHEEARQAHSA